MKRSPFVTGIISGLFLAAIVSLLGLKRPLYGLILVAMNLVWVAGAIYGVYYLQRADKNTRWLKVLFWSNVVTWIVPPLGFFTCAATRNINLRNQGADRLLFMRLARMCFVLSIISSIILTKILT